MSIDYTSYSDDPIIDDVPTFEETITEEVDEHPMMMGKIYNTKQVYLRKEPSKDSPHISILDKDDEVMIDGTATDKLGNGWYHIITASGNEGYTMSDYVKIVE